MQGLGVFLLVATLPTGQRSFEVYAVDGEQAVAAVETVLGNEGLCGPFDIVIESGRDFVQRPSWLLGTW